MVPILLRAAAFWSDGIRLCLTDGPASGRMMGYAYRNVAGGRGPLGRWLDRRFLNYPGWDGVRRRRACLETLVTGAIETLARDGRKKIHLLDVAGGTADYVVAAVAARSAGTVSAVCVDLDPKVAEQGRASARQAGVAGVRFEVGDATDEAALSRVAGRPDVAVCSGLYELLTDDATVTASINTVARLLSPGGYFVVGHQTARPPAGVFARSFKTQSAGPTDMAMRTPETVAEMLRAGGFDVQRSLSAADLYILFPGPADVMDLGLYQLKYPVRRLNGGVLPWVRDVPPDRVSWLILPVGVATAGCYFASDRHPFLLVAGTILILIRMFLATLDGLMAVTFGKSSPRGEIVNRVPAELSDVLLILALAAAPARMARVVAVAVGWLTTFAGLVGPTAGLPTQSVGPVGQTDRLTALIVFSLAGTAARLAGHPVDAMKAFLWWAVLGGTFTVALRLARTFRASSGPRR